ncbi:hypothetical protein [Kribbella sp. NPDC049227]|uniref:hypothetical protein n=1 Tax=Kribbella sp. NPDC049227 TaxID=3364113 RepID=UPI00371BF9B1
MPARSNDFQAVVYFVKKHIAPDAAVTESAMLVDRITGQRREVDVLITATLAGQQLSIGIEARDHKRRQGIEWVEQVAQKHSSLPINQTVLVSSSGFTKRAEERAALLGIEAVTPSQSIRQDGPLAALQLSIEAREVRWTGEVDVRVLCEGQESGAELDLEARLFAADGTYLCTAQTFVQEALANIDTTTLGTVTATANPKSNWLQIRIEPVLAHHPRTAEQTTVHIASPTSDSGLSRILRAQIAVSTQLRIVPLGMSSQQLQGVEYAVGRGQVLDQDALMVVTTDTGEPTASIRLTDRDRNVVDLNRDDIIRIEPT